MTTRHAARMLILIVAAALAVEDRIAAQVPSAAQGACTPQIAGPAVFDVPSVAVQPRFRLNGRTFPGPEAGAALFTLWASEASDYFDGPQLVLGETHLPPHTVRVVPGVYDVYYSWITGSDVPRNHLTRVLHRVSLDRDRDLTIDVPMIRVGGVKQHNGNPFGYDGARRAEPARRRLAGRGAAGRRTARGVPGGHDPGEVRLPVRLAAGRRLSEQPPRLRPAGGSSDQRKTSRAERAERYPAVRSSSTTARHFRTRFSSAGTSFCDAATARECASGRRTSRTRRFG